MVVVFIESNFSGAEAIAKATHAGFDTILLTSDYRHLLSILPKNCETLLKQSSRIIEVEDSMNLDSLEAGLKKHDLRPDAVLTFSQPYTIVAAELANALSVPHTNIQATRTARNKFEMRKVLRRHGVESVSAALANSPNEILEVSKIIGFPLVLKPNSGQASIGIFVCRTERDIVNALGSIHNDTNMSISSTYLVEEFLEGPLYSVETLTYSKEKHTIWGIADRDLLNGSIEIASTFPVSPPQYKEITDKVETALNAIGYDLGAAHTEIILTDNGPRIVEINARVGGSGHLQMMELATGKSLSLDIVNCHLGRDQMELGNFLGSQPKRGACWRAVIGQHEGVIERIPAKNQLLSLPGVRDVWSFRSEGERYCPNQSNFDWILEILAEGETVEEARQRAEVAHDIAISKLVLNGDTSSEKKNANS